MEEITRASLLSLIESYVADGNSWHALAIESGVSYANLVDFKRGKAELPRGKNLLKLMQVLQPGSATPTPPQAITAGYVGDGARVFLKDPSFAPGMAEAPPRSGYGKKGPTHALDVRSDSLGPFITEGFRLFYDTRHPGMPKEHLNKICIVQLVNGPCLVMRVQKGTKAGRYHLTPLNSAEPSIENAEIEWAAYVTSMAQG